MAAEAAAATAADMLQVLLRMELIKRLLIFLRNHINGKRVRERIHGREERHAREYISKGSNRGIGGRGSVDVRCGEGDKGGTHAKKPTSSK